MSFTSASSRVRPVSLVKRTDKAGQRGPLAAKQGASFQQDTAQMAMFLKYLQYGIIVGFVVLIALLANFSTTSYRLFATTEEGKLTAPPPIDQEIGDNIVNLWVVDAVTRAMTLGFHDYQTRMLEIRPLFNDRGWESFTRFQRGPYANLPSIRSQLETGFLMMRAVPRAPPQIQDKSLVGGIFTYRIEIKLTVTRYGAGSNDMTNLEVYEVLVERVKPEVNPSGIAIAQWRYTGGA